jgi:hypothetical protein
MAGEGPSSKSQKRKVVYRFLPPRQIKTETELLRVSHLRSHLKGASEMSLALPHCNLMEDF